MAFDAIVQAALAGRSLQADFLVHMDFRDTPKRFWTGWGELDAAGYRWQGMGGLVAIDGLEQATGTVATETTFTLSGLDADVVSAAVGAADRAVGRRVQVFMQMFDVSGNHQPLAEPFAVWTGTMGEPRFTADSGTRQVAISALSLMSRRNSPPHGYYTDRDQQARYPGDKGLSLIPTLNQKQIRWPNY